MDPTPRARALCADFARLAPHPSFDPLRAFARAGDVDVLVAIGEYATRAHVSALGGQRAAERLREAVFQLVALVPQPDAGAALFRLLRSRRAEGLRDEAARCETLELCALAFAQSPATLLRALRHRTAADREFLAVWLHGAIAYGASVESDEASAFRADLRAAGHSLGALALARRDWEHRAARCLPTWNDFLGPYGSNHGGALGPAPMDPFTYDRRPVLWERRDDLLEGEAAADWSAAVASWWARPGNAIHERALFDLVPALTPLDAPGVLTELGLACLPTGAGRVRCAPIDADDAYASLLDCAANGSLSGAALGPAYGRLAAQKSLGALAGAPPLALREASERGTEIEIEQASWFAFSSGWFHGDIWDHGLACLRVGGERLAVFAVSDCD